ncbi:MAG: Ig-like domain-containing protein, partial [Pseudomonas sp.]
GGSVTEAGLAGGSDAGNGNAYTGNLSLQPGWTAQAASGTTANGTYTVNADGTYTFTLTSATTDVAGQAETNSFTYTAKDANGNSVTNTVTVTIVDDTPVAVNDSGNVTEGATLSVTAAAGVLSNDKAGADGWNASGAVVGVSNSSSVQGTASATGFTIVGQYGTLTLNKDGSYSYTANANAVSKAEADVFTYTVKDSDGDEKTATLTINVADVTGTPVTTTGGSVTEAGLAGGSDAGNGNAYTGNL